MRAVLKVALRKVLLKVSFWEGWTVARRAYVMSVSPYGMKKKKKTSLPTPDWKKLARKQLVWVYTSNTKTQVMNFCTFPRSGKRKKGEKSFGQSTKRIEMVNFGNLWRAADVIDKVQRVKRTLTRDSNNTENGWSCYKTSFFQNGA